MRHRLLALFMALMGVSTLLVAAPTAQAAPAPAPSPGRYVALGDSYSSGAGLYPYSNTACYRSTLAYPNQLKGKMALTNATCSSATTATILNQLPPAPDPGVSKVTLTVGGNDLGFAAVLSDCVAHSAAPDGCSAATKAAVATKLESMSGKISAVVTAVRAKYPAATIYVGGYPAFFGDNLTTSCRVGTYLAVYPLTVKPADATWMNGVSASLNTRIQAGISASGVKNVRYANAAAPFDGHGLCDTSKAWINGARLLTPSTPWEGSFHPTLSGQAAYKSAFLKAGF